MPRILWYMLAAIDLLAAIAPTCAAAGATEPDGPSEAGGRGATVVRVAEFNVQDVRTPDLLNREHPRLKQIAGVLQRIRPNVVLISEIAYDAPGAPGVEADQEPGQNGQRLADNFLAVPQEPDLKPLRYRAFMAPVNTGMPSGFDLNNDGTVTARFPAPNPNGPMGTPGAQSAAGRAYAGDCWGFGTFPGQYGMALLVDERLEILEDQVRTFRLLPWDYMPGAFLPPGPDGEGSWYDDDERALVRLSSKSHWDVPVRLPNGAVVHFLCSHPSPPAFDGPEKRNARRNHDEIRFWANYIEGSTYIVDDAGHPGSLEPGALFVILGDLNADPDEGSSFKDPIGTLLFSNPRINTSATPVADRAWPGLEADDTSTFGLRVDYVLPSKAIPVIRASVWRTGWRSIGRRRAVPSDHFPVWAELRIPAPGD